MKPSIENAEVLLGRVAKTEQRLANYERKLSKAIQRGGPSGISGIDLTKPVVQGSRQEEDIVEHSDEISRLMLIIQEIKDEAGDILTTVSQLEMNERRVIELWYIKKLTKREIADALNYASTHSIYTLRNKALAQFVELYPW